MATNDVFLYGGETNPTDVKLRDPTTSAIAAYTLIVLPGTVPAVGQNIVLRAGYGLVELPGTVPVVGQSLALQLNRRLAVSPVDVPVAGRTLALSAARYIAVAPTAVPINGQGIGLAAGYRLAITPTDVPVVGQDITLTFTAASGNRTLSIDPATVAIVGQAIDLVYTPIVSVAVQPASGGIWVRSDQEKRPKARSKTAVKTAAYILAVVPAKVATAGQLVGACAHRRVAIAPTHIVLFATEQQRRTHAALSLLLGTQVVDIGARRTSHVSREIAALKLLAEAA
jgi:hypothetical protein